MIIISTKNVVILINENILECKFRVCLFLSHIIWICGKY